jgi:hypothetical protein
MVCLALDVDPCVFSFSFCAGVLVLSPRAVERLETFKPVNRPLPKIFRMLKKGKLDTWVLGAVAILRIVTFCEQRNF